MHYQPIVKIFPDVGCSAVGIVIGVDEIESKAAGHFEHKHALKPPHRYAANEKETPPANEQQEKTHIGGRKEDFEEGVHVFKSKMEGARDEVGGLINLN